MKCTLLSIILIFSLGIKVAAQFHTITPFGKRGLPEDDPALVNQPMNDSTGSVEVVDSVEIRNLPLSPVVAFHAPLKNIRYTSRYGKRTHPVTGELKNHNGVDLRAVYEPVYNIAKGIVVRTAYASIEGNYILIRHGNMMSIYCHLEKVFCYPGQELEAGAVIGITGNTGRSTGPHLHFGLKLNGRFIDPAFFLRLLQTKPI